MRRDFTINALALDPLNDYLIDEVEGLRDLDAKTVRFIGDPATRIKEDPLRVMRGIRFVHQLEFKFAATTDVAIQTAIKDGVLGQIATDRLRQELNAMLLLPKKRTLIGLLDNIGVLAAVLPEVLAGKDVTQPDDMHAEGDVFTHTLLAVDCLQPGASLRLVWATLLHDIGKPPTQELPKAPGDRIRFSSHYRIGAKMASGILERLNFSKKFISEVAWMIEYHLGIDDLPKMTKAHQRTMMENDAFSDLLELHRADARASWTKTSRGDVYKPEPKFSEIKAIWNDFKASQAKPRPSLKLDLGIDGNWLKQKFSIKDGKKLGALLDILNTSYLDGKIRSVADAEAIVRKQNIL
jgi:poly(A) polymerase